MEILNKQFKELFETCYADGDKEIDMEGVGSYIKEAYRQYYAWRKEHEKEKEGTIPKSILIKG